MSSKSFPGIDEFTSHRIVKDAQGDGKRSDFELSAEVRVLQSTDPYSLVRETLGREPTDGEHLGAIHMQMAMSRARLETLGDMHQGMSADAAEAFLTELGMRCALKEPAPMKGSYQIWAQPLTGVVVAGTLYPARTLLHAYLQWSPWLESMTEKEEAELTSSVRAIFGNSAGYAFCNPDRPHLQHGSLHYPSCYTDITPEERSSWEASYDAIPDRILRERGHWVLNVTAGIAAGLWAPLASLERRAGKFMPVWSACLNTAFMAEGVLGQERERERRFDACPDWLKTIIGAGWAFSLQNREASVAPGL